MRIALTNWSNRLAGGAETYLATILEEFENRGHKVGFWHETSNAASRPVIPAGPKVTSWDASRLGVEESLRRLARWNPDVIYCQGMLNPALESATLDIAPGVFFAHNYHGICISGSKSTAFPIIQPCSHRLGLACLARYLPLRCGGPNPLTMLENYRINRERLRVMSRYSRVITHSSWLMDQYRNNGVACERVRFFAPIPQPNGFESWKEDRQWRLLMMGRMVENKGGAVLIDSLRLLASRMDKPIHLTMAGDGSSRLDWQKRAQQVVADNPGLQISFPGWLTAEQLKTQLSQTDLLVMPSLWPEPFGLAGMEAAAMGIPAVGFRVGGIPDWLTDGVNGALAGSNPPSPASLADAISRCLSSSDHLSHLRIGAREAAKKLNLAGHYEDLMQVFDDVSRSRERAIA